MSNEPGKGETNDCCPVFWTRLTELMRRKTGKRFQIKSVAKIAGVSLGTVYRWQSGESSPLEKTLETLRLHFNCDIEHLTGDAALPDDVGYPKAVENPVGMGQKNLDDARSRTANDPLEDVGEELIEEFITTTAKKTRIKNKRLKQLLLRIVSTLALLISVIAGCFGHTKTAVACAAAGFIVGGASLFLARAAKGAKLFVLLILAPNAVAAVTLGVMVVKEKFRVPPPPPPPPIVAVDPDLAPAQHALTLRATIRLNGNEKGISKQAELDSAAADLKTKGIELRLTGLILKEEGEKQRAVSDESFSQFRGCKYLTHLALDNVSVGDKGLSHFAGNKSLQYLALGRTNLTDAGLFNFQGCTELTNLDLYETEVTDEGLKAFEGCTKLMWLLVGDNGQKKKRAVSDAGLRLFEGCTELKIMNLSCTRVSVGEVLKFKGRKLEQVILTGAMTKPQIDQLKAVFPPGVIISERDRP